MYSRTEQNIMGIIDDLLGGQEVPFPAPPPRAAGLPLPVGPYAALQSDFDAGAVTLAPPLLEYSPLYPLLTAPATQLEYLRTLFFIQVIKDTTGTSPYGVFAEGLRARCRNEAPKRAQKRHESYWRARRDAIESEEYGSMRRRLLQQLPGRDEAQLEAVARRDAKDIADSVIAKLISEGPNDFDLRSSLGDAAQEVAEDEDWLSKRAEDVAYQLKVSAFPHDWLNARLLWEAKDFLWDLQCRCRASVNFVGSLTFLRPPWRREGLLPKPRQSVDIRLFLDESDEEHRVKREQARRELASLREKRRGRRPWDGDPPSDEELVRLVYLNLRGDSYQKLTNNDAAVRGIHYKTLGEHLTEIRKQIFSADLGKGAN